MIDFLMGFILSIINVLTPGINSPLPPEVATYITLALEYVVMGCQILGQFIDLSYLMVLYVFILDVEVAIFAFRAVMWVLRKIPLISVR